MRKNFLLLLWLTLLPLAGWAQTYTQTVNWLSGGPTKEFSYLAMPTESDFPGLVNVRTTASYSFSNLYGWYSGTETEDFVCVSQGVGTDYPTADASQYYYNIYASETSETPIPAGDLAAGGSYVLRLYVKYVSGATATHSWSPWQWNWAVNSYATKTYNLPFTITNKPEVTVKVYSLTRTWDDPWTSEPTIADFNSTPELRSVSGATTNWNDVKDYLDYKRVDNGTNVGTYAYTLTTTTHPSYTIHIDDASAKLNITQATNVWNSTPVVAAWTYGDEVTEASDKITVDAKYGSQTATFEFFKGSESLGDAIPTEAGDYTVVVTVPETINYTEIVSAAIPFTIDKAATTIEITEVPGAPFTYPADDFDETKITYTSDSDGAIDSYTFTKDGNPAAWDGSAGTWTVTIALEEGTNWLATTSLPFTFVVNKADIDAATLVDPVAIPDLVYDETNQQLITAGSVTGGTLWYKAEGGDWQTDVTKVTGKNAGLYTIYYYVKGDENHNDLASEAEPYTLIEDAAGAIAKSPVLRTPGPAVVGDLTFNGTEQRLTQAGKYFTGVKGGTVTYYAKGEIEDAATEYTSTDKVMKKNADTYTVSYKFFADDSGNYKDDEEETEIGKVTIGQYTLYIGGNELTKTIEEVVDLETNTPLISMADFINEGAFLAADGLTPDEEDAILNQLIVPTQTIEEIIANAKLGTNSVGLSKVDVAPAVGAPMNYKVDESTLLSNAASLTLVAIEAAIQADPAGYADLAYNGEDQELIETPAEGYKAMGGTGTVAIGKVVYSLEKEGTYTEDLSTIIGKDADEYEVFYKVELDPSTKAANLDKFYEYTGGVKSIKVTIAQAANEITNLALEGWTYGAEANKPEADALFKAEGEPTFTYSDSETGTFTEEVPTNAGTWYVKASVAETTNWAAAEKTISFEISKAVAAIATAPAAKELVYNREAQELVEAGVSEDGTVLYSLTGDAADFAEAIPTGTDAGVYNVYYMVKGDANHTDLVVAEPVVVTIAPADVKDIVAPVAINLTYNGYDQALAEPATFEDEFVKGTFQYSIDGENWSDDIPVAKNAGEYTVQTKFTPNANHNEATVADVKVTINKATIGYNLSNLEKVWDGELFGEEEISKLFTLYAGGEGGKLFGDDEYDKPFTLTLPEDYRDAGTYTFKQPKVEFKTKEGGYEKDYPVNYNVTFAGEAQVIIDKADLVEVDDYTAPAAIGGLVYDFGNKMDLVTPGSVTSKNAEDYPNTEIAGKEYGTIVFSTEKDGEYTEDIPQGDLAGEYSVWFKVAGDINHNDTEPVEITNTIGTYELTADFLPEEYKTELPYKAAPYEASDFIPALEGITEDAGYTVGTSEMKDAGEYVILYTGINNLSGSFEVKVNITPIDVIAVAPKGIKKVYDGTASLEGVVKNGDISFVGVLSGDKITLPEDLALSTEGIAVGTYPIKVDAAAINDLNKNYNILDESIDGELTITKAPAFTIGFDAVPATWTKEFGEKDPDLTGYTVKEIAEEGKSKFFDDIADVLAATTAEREPGDNVGTYAVSLKIDETAEVFANYEGVNWDEAAAEFTITKSEKVYTVSVANITETYKAEEFETALTIAPEDLVIAGYEGDLDKFFDAEGLPTATIPEGAIDAGEYNITLSGGASTNFNFTFVPATFTIKPFEVTTATIEAQKVQKGKALDVTKFTITAPTPILKDEEGNEIEVFYVTAPGLVNMDDVVTGEAGVYADGLVIAVDESVADNYVGLDKFTAELEIIAADAIVLADDEDFVTEDKDGVDVTFASRTLNAGTWNVVALPFEATIAQISNAFGYAAVDILDESNKKTDEIHFMITTSGSIPAYTPFIVKTTDDEGLKKTNFDQVVFHNVNLEASEGENKAISDGAGNQFIGTFKGETTFWGKKYRYMSKGAWYNAAAYSESNPVKIKAFRGYIEMVNASARIFIEEPDGTVTAIDAVNFNKAEAEGMYNLNGVKVNNANRKGVFIQNGKKVINK